VTVAEEYGLMDQRPLSPQTLAAQGLGETGAATGGLAPVISLSTNYEQQPDGSYPQGRVYIRADNPTCEHAERLLRPGVLRGVDGRDSAAAVPGITGLTITIAAGQQVRPLPDGDRYLGFIFAEAATRYEVEQALTAARGQLRVIID
jgi:L-amino acid ligase C-terminal domain 2